MPDDACVRCVCAALRLRCPGIVTGWLAALWVVGAALAWRACWGLGACVGLLSGKLLLRLAAGAASDWFAD